ncbi:MAG TPA: PDZ domain-containing protein, partial [Thermoanaerobaculia bacterium]
MKRKTMQRTAAALALAALPFLALPAAAADDADGEKREIVVLTKVGDGEGAPRVFTHVLGGGFLGVELMSLTPELRAHFGVPADRGVMVARVVEDSPAARAGLQVGDVIAGVEGKGVESPWDLTMAVRGKEAGETARLEVWRDGRGLDFDVTIEERERRKIDLGGLQWKGTLDGPHAIRLRERLVP